MRYIFLFLVFTMIAAPSVAQRKGEIRVGLTVGYPSKTGLSFRYYVADGLGVEMHGHVIGAPGAGATLGIGGALNIHPVPDKPYYGVINFNYTQFSRVEGTSPTDPPVLAAGREDLSLGAGAELTSNRDSLYLSGAAGTNINLWRTVTSPGADPDVETGTTHWSIKPYVEAGFGYRSPTEAEQ